jgi:mannose-6-phosphate isomerase-like protein (cupin superfamily)
MNRCGKGGTNNERYGANPAATRRGRGDAAGARAPVRAAVAPWLDGAALVRAEITDPRTPHGRDELYVVVAGRGWFMRGEGRVAFRPGDAIFVPANLPHRFEDFTPGLALWVIFYGPVGGETPQA